MKTFRHDINERNKTNVLKLRMKYGAAGYGVYMMLLERLAAEPQLRAELDYDVLAFDFHVEADMIRHIIEDFDLFVIDLDGNFFYHEEQTAQLTPKAQQARQEKMLDEFIAYQSVNKHWIESTAEKHNTTPDRIRTILQTSFREKILAQFPRLPQSTYLCMLLRAHIDSHFPHSRT